MALVLAGRRREAERAFEWLASTQLPDGTWCRYYLAEGVEDPRRDPNVGAYVATGVWWHYLCTGDLGLLESMWPVVEARRRLRAAPAAARRRGAVVDGSRRAPRAATPCSPARPRSTTACAVPWPSPSASGSNGRSGSWPPTGWSRRSSTGRAASRPRTAGPWTGTTRSCPARSPASRPASGSTGAGRSSCSTGVGVRCVSDQPWVTAAETAECVMALDAVGRRDQAARPARLDPASAPRRRRLLDRLRAPRMRPVSRAASAAPTPPPPSLLADHALYGFGPSAGLFRGETLPGVVDVAGVARAARRRR